MNAYKKKSNEIFAIAVLFFFFSSIYYSVAAPDYSNLQSFQGIVKDSNRETITGSYGTTPYRVIELVSGSSQNTIYIKIIKGLKKITVGDSVSVKAEKSLTKNIFYAWEVIVNDKIVIPFEHYVKIEQRQGRGLILISFIMMVVAFAVRVYGNVKQR